MVGRRSRSNDCVAKSDWSISHSAGYDLWGDLVPPYDAADSLNQLSEAKLRRGRMVIRVSFVVKWR